MQFDCSTLPTTPKVPTPRSFGVCVLGCESDSRPLTLRLLHDLCAASWREGDGSAPVLIVSGELQRASYRGIARTCLHYDPLTSDNRVEVVHPFGKCDWTVHPACLPGEVWAIGHRDLSAYEADPAAWLQLARERSRTACIEPITGSSAVLVGLSNLLQGWPS